MPSPYYFERTRRARRQFTLTESTLQVTGKLSGLKYSREFEFTSLSSDSQNIVETRFDIVRRCGMLAMLSLGAGWLIGAQRFPYAHYVSWLFFGIALLFLKSGYDWISQKEEAEIFKTKEGTWAFEIYNDSPGSADFSNFIRALKARIESSAGS